jgi:transposase
MYSFYTKESVITLTREARFFLEPRSAAQRQYEALRAYFVENLPSREAAHRFSYSPGAFRVLCWQFRRHHPDFFSQRKPGPKAQPKTNAARPLIIALRKQNHSVYDIERVLKSRGTPLSDTAVWEVLRQEGFARLPRRADDELPGRPKPEAAAVADRREFSLAPARFSTQLGGLFLFLPWLVDGDWPALVQHAKFPGTKMIPALQALLSVLGLKLCSRERKSHVMDLVFDPGLALFAGLNVPPKTTYLTTYSDRVGPKMMEALRAGWLKVLRAHKLVQGQGFNLDFHAIPYFGRDEFVERHYLSKRSRSQRSILVFLAQEADSQVVCYSCADVPKRQQPDQVLRFVGFWRQQTGRLPQELVFDSKLTTFANLSRLAQMGITFMTLRRRSPGLLRQVANIPRSAWRTVHLDVPHRQYQNPRVFDQRVSLKGYEGQVRQLFITELGHEEPTILLTNDLDGAASGRITRYAQRMLIENHLADAVDFFHLDALSSAVALKVDFDVGLTEIATGLYRLFARQLSGYETAKARQIYRHFLDTPAQVEIAEQTIEVRLPKRAHNPLLIAAGVGSKQVSVPWWNNYKLAISFA